MERWNLSVRRWKDRGVFTPRSYAAVLGEEDAPRFCRGYVYGETRTIARFRRVRTSRQGWKHLARDASRPESLDGRENCELRQTRYETPSGDFPFSGFARANLGLDS